MWNPFKTRPDTPPLTLIRKDAARPGSGRRGWHVLVARFEALLARRWPWAVLLVLAGAFLLAPPFSFFRAAHGPGSIARFDVVAPQDLVIPDDETTAAKRRRAADEVPIVYDFDSDAGETAANAIEAAFAQARRTLQSWQGKNRGTDAVAALGQPAGHGLVAALGEAFSDRDIELSSEALGVLVRHSFSAEFEKSLKATYLKVLRRGVVANKMLLIESRERGILVRDLGTAQTAMRYDVLNVIDYRKELRDFVEEELVELPRLPAKERRVVVDAIVASLVPNLTVNNPETSAARRRAGEAVDPVFRRIPRGKVIVRRGDEITPAIFSQLRVLETHRDGRGEWSRFLGLAAVMTFFAFLWWMFLDRYQRSRSTTYSLIVIVLLSHLLFFKLLVVIATAVGSSFALPPFNSVGSYYYAIPFAAAAVAVYLLSGISVAVMFTVLYSIVCGLLMGQGLTFVLYTLISSLVGLYSMGQLERRTTLMRAGVVMGCANVYAVLTLHLLEASGSPLSRLGFDAFCGFLGGIQTAALVSFAIPLFENLFHVTTVIRLLELSNQNLPLLRRLALEAPGTYQHSLMVGNLAEAAADAVGANSLLARVRGYYHDIGKCRRPEYFIENQRGVNKHEKLAPSMSYLIITSHVTDGIEMAAKQRLPETLIAGIREHHGTKLVRYFFDRAKAQNPDRAGEVREIDFRYPGPLPRDKENGILMLADSVEAASRTVADPTPAKLKAMIRSIIDDALADRQLDGCDLTLKDLDKIADSFLWILASASHQRIDYPGFEFNRSKRSDAGSSTSPGQRRNA